MGKEYTNDSYIERMYLLGKALLNYFNGLEITDEEAFLISKVNDSDIIPAITVARLCNDNNKNSYFEKSTTKIKIARNISQAKKKK